MRATRGAIQRVRVHFGGTREAAEAAQDATPEAAYEREVHEEVGDVRETAEREEERADRQNHRKQLRLALDRQVLIDQLERLPEGEHREVEQNVQEAERHRHARHPDAPAVRPFPERVGGRLHPLPEAVNERCASHVHSVLAVETHGSGRLERVGSPRAALVHCGAAPLLAVASARLVAAREVRSRERRERRAILALDVQPPDFEEDEEAEQSARENRNHEAHELRVQTEVLVVRVVQIDVDEYPWEYFGRRLDDVELRAEDGQICDRRRGGEEEEHEVRAQ